MERRTFLKRSIKYFFAFLGLSSLLSLTFLYPSKIKKKEISFFDILNEEEIPKKGVKRVYYEYEIKGRIVSSKAYLAITEGGLAAFSPVCSHLGCLVNWDINREEFLCPCHGGRYNMDGEVIAGPPTAPLTRLPLEIKDGRVFVGLKV